MTSGVRGCTLAIVPNSLQVLIVDDEPIARALLVEELAAMRNVKVIGEADTGGAALAAIETLRPDLVLLDVQMPGCDGFEVMRRISGPVIPAVVFVTAFDAHAIRAFEHGALDYLLKPVSADRLQAALDRVWQRHLNSRDSAERAARAAELGSPQARKVIGRRGEEYFLLALEDVMAFRADGEIVWIHTSTERYMAVHTLRGIEERLDSKRFRRIHRNAIVNLDHVRKLSSLSSQRWLLTMANQQELVVSKRQVSAIREILNL